MFNNCWTLCILIYGHNLANFWLIKTKNARRKEKLAGWNNDVKEREKNRKEMRNYALLFTPFFRSRSGCCVGHPCVKRGALQSEMNWGPETQRKKQSALQMSRKHGLRIMHLRERVVMSLFYSSHNGHHQLACRPKQGSRQLKNVTSVREKQPRTGHFHKVLLQAGCPSFRENLCFKTLFSIFSEKFYTLASLKKAAQDNTLVWKEDNVSLSTEIATRTASLNLKNVKYS